MIFFICQSAACTWNLPRVHGCSSVGGEWAKGAWHLPQSTAWGEIATLHIQTHFHCSLHIVRHWIDWKWIPCFSESFSLARLYSPPSTSLQHTFRTVKRRWRMDHKSFEHTIYTQKTVVSLDEILFQAFIDKQSFSGLFWAFKWNSFSILHFFIDSLYMKTIYCIWIYQEKIFCEYISERNAFCWGYRTLLGILRPQVSFSCINVIYIYIYIYNKFPFCLLDTCHINYTKVCMIEIIVQYVIMLIHDTLINGIW